jgi:glycosyltransferase involved in cell wall biosynthesis
VSSTATDRRRILVLIKGLGIGGAERLLADAAPHWDHTAFQYRVAYILPWKDQLADVIAEAGVAVSCIGGKHGMDPATPARLRRLIGDYEPNLIHAHLPAAGILARLASNRPLVYTEHNVVDSYRQPTRTLNRLTYVRNRAVVAVSDAVAASIEGYPGPDPIVIPNGVPARMDVDVTTVRSELGIDDETPLIVHVGNIRPHKGHATLVAATAQLAGRIPNIAVVSIGGEKDEGDLAKVRQQAESAGVSSRISFLGRRDDARRFLAAADVVVNPSDFEGLPVAILEALRFRRPVVATNVGGVSAVVRDAETGLLVDPSNPGQLADAIARAITDPEAEKWGSNGAELVATSHSVEAMVAAYEKVYWEALGV